MSLPDPATLHELVLDTLGVEIIDGLLVPGDVVTLDQLQERFEVSRTVVRDAVRMLESLGFVEPRRRIGIRICPAADWRVLDPRVIRWRLNSTERDAQFRDVTELRVAVEPLAAERAAERASEQAQVEIMHLARELRRLGEAGDLEAFLVVDISFHTLLLRESGNRQFLALAEAVGTMLAERTWQHRMPFRPRPEALAEHEAVAAAVACRDGAEAARAARAIACEAGRALGVNG